LPPEHEGLFRDGLFREGFGSWTKAECWVAAMNFSAYYEFSMRPEFGKRLTRTVVARQGMLVGIFV
jgi:hypothetical protein